MIIYTNYYNTKLKLLNYLNEEQMKYYERSEIEKRLEQEF